MNDQLRNALDALSPHGLALKQHVLRKLIDSSPEQLTIAEVMQGGPSRTDASVRGALKTLDRIGAVQFLSQDETGDVARCRIAPDAQDAVRAFLRPQDEESRPLSPLPPRRAYQQVLRAMYEAPEQTFTLKALLDKVWGERTSVRTPLAELFEAGYLLRDLTDESRHGRPEYTYRLNPDAKDHADVLLCAPTCSPQRRS
ncbi:hypothetical protein [Lentzea albidocapillata]|uniref:Uncharacterized protein n=1 Tax=Lentzea albidocapillata TaxID=40571 RepID=A0A1W2FLC5_9PSEU|nr:hypothetical protein [Lentzea albidocapillata]SMD22502.1 hypothetical protein SAMN05660733_06841 [Lentzea albidocapillata]